MPITEAEIKTSPVNHELCEITEQEILDILNKNKLNLRELVIVLGLLCIDMGGGLGQKEYLNITDAWREYGENPNFANSLAALGADLLYHWANVKDEDIIRKTNE